MIIGISEIMLLRVTEQKEVSRVILHTRQLVAQDITNALPTNNFETQMEA